MLGTVPSHRTLSPHPSVYFAFFAEGLHFSAFHYVCIYLCQNIFLPWFLLVAIQCFLHIDKRVYVSVAVGQSRKRTKTFKGDGIPYWNEEFSL